MQNVLVVVDMQNDFIDGALGTKEAVAIVPNVKEKIKNFQGTVLFTRDTHFENYMDTQEGKNLPLPHCIKDTEGWQIRAELMDVLGEDVADVTIIDKDRFGYTDWASYTAEELGDIELVGLCTDICVVSNAIILKALFPETKMSVDASCCAGVTPATHKAALDTMRCCQIDIINE